VGRGGGLQHPGKGPGQNTKRWVFFAARKQKKIFSFQGGGPKGFSGGGQNKFLAGGEKNLHAVVAKKTLFSFKTQIPPTDSFGARGGNRPGTLGSHFMGPVGNQEKSGQSRGEFEIFSRGGKAPKKQFFNRPGQKKIFCCAFPRVKKSFFPFLPKKTRAERGGDHFKQNQTIFHLAPAQ